MDAGPPSNDSTPARSSVKRFSFESSPDEEQDLGQASGGSIKIRRCSNDLSAVSSQSPVFSGDDPAQEPLNSSQRSNCNPFSEHNTTSMDIPEFDPELLQNEYMSQDLFDQEDAHSVHSERDDCEIVDIVQRDVSQGDALGLENLTMFNLAAGENGSTSDPIFVDDTATSNGPNDSAAPSPNRSSHPNRPRSAPAQPEPDNDDCIMGPIHWATKRMPQFPLDYYRPSRNFSNAYRFLDNEDPGTFSSLEDIEFLFKCPICYSTITRLRSGKVPNDNDKVIYSTKCGHLFCYECIESVKSRRECSICRKQVKDKNQYHVVFP